MKDSQRRVGAVRDDLKYIKVNNERFSTVWTSPPRLR